jgi:hypothetical protein
MESIRPAASGQRCLGDQLPTALMRSEALWYIER